MYCVCVSLVTILLLVFYSYCGASQRGHIASAIAAASAGISATRCSVLLRLLLGTSHLLTRMLYLKVLDTQIEPHHIVYDEFLLHNVLGRGAQHCERFTQACARFAHLVPAERGANDYQGHLEDDAYALGEKAIPDTQERLPGQGASHGAQKPIGHIKQRLHFVLLQMTIDGWAGFLKQALQYARIVLYHLETRYKIILQVTARE